eukprot:768444-Hanusia_phi.AAC.8
MEDCLEDANDEIVTTHLALRNVSELLALSSPSLLPPPSSPHSSLLSPLAPSLPTFLPFLLHLILNLLSYPGRQAQPHERLLLGQNHGVPNITGSTS